MRDVTVRGLGKTFGAQQVLAGLDLEVPAGSLTAILGPSGSGTTTLLRLLAGFERADTGEIGIGGVQVDGPGVYLPPERRRIGYVPQEGSLFPHLTVAGNVGFGLPASRRRGGKVDPLLETVGLGGFGRRYPHQLSGGQQQRVALARALVLRPAVLLLDEPLGALDAQIRKQLRLELKALQEEVGITFVFVTHDQEEALSMSDRVAVMNDGRIEQIGTPPEVYESPGTVFVADFLGVSNLMDAEAEPGPSGGCTVRIGEFRLTAGCGELTAQGPVKIIARPERISLRDRGDGAPHGNCLPGMVERTVYVGASLQVMVRLATGAALQASVTNTGAAASWMQGTPVVAEIPPDALRVLAGDPGKRCQNDPGGDVHEQLPVEPAVAG